MEHVVTPCFAGPSLSWWFVLVELPSRVLVLTTYDVDGYVYDALAAGAAGFLLKATPPDRLVEGIRTVAVGEALLAPTLTQRLIEAYLRQPPPVDGVPAELATLTERERRCWC